MNREDLGDLKEYEALGYQISRLTDFCKEYDFACLAFVQLNNIRNRNTQIAMEQDQLNVLAQHYTNVLKENLPEEIKEEQESKQD